MKKQGLGHIVSTYLDTATATKLTRLAEDLGLGCSAAAAGLIRAALVAGLDPVKSNQPRGRPGSTAYALRKAVAVLDSATREQILAELPPNMARFGADLLEVWVSKGTVVEEENGLISFPPRLFSEEPGNPIEDCVSAALEADPVDM